MPVADINDIKIAYEIYGDGEPLILIHGYSYNNFFIYLDKFIRTSI